MTRWIALAIAIAACEPDAKPGPSIAPSAPADARDTVADATKPALAPAPAPTTTTIPDALANAPAVIFRRYYTGMIAVPTVVTFTLRRHDHAALLVVEKQSGKRIVRPGANRRDDFVIGNWTVVSTTRYLGTATDAGVLALTDLDKPATLQLTCKNRRMVVAGPDAVRRPGVPPRGGCEGETGRWVPAKTTRAELLYCYSAEPASGAPEDSDWNAYGDYMHVAFAPAPGVEWLYVNDDCIMQGGGFRWIAKDGAIASER